jgi:hypothetical protein
MEAMAPQPLAPILSPAPNCTILPLRAKALLTDRDRHGGPLLKDKNVKRPQMIALKECDKVLIKPGGLYF